MFARVFAIQMVGALGVAVLLTGCSGGPSPAPPTFREQSEHVPYSISILPGIGGTSSSADGINNRGWITGWSTLSGSMNPEHEMLWVGKRKFDFGTLGGPSSDSAFAKKGNTNDVPGVSETSMKDPLGEDFCYFGTGYTCLGTDWRHGDLDALPVLGGNNGSAIGNNDRGQIVGVSETKVRDPNCVAPQVLDFEAVLWEPRSHSVKELRPLSGDRVGVATAINDRGDIVGGSSPTCATLTPAIGLHPLLWKNGSPVLLPTLGGTMNNVPWMINQRGEMAGSANVAGDTTTHAVLWRNPKTIEDLGTLPGDFSSVALSMNDKEQLVGQSCDASYNCRGFIWQNGVMSDINALISGGSRYYVLTANDINDDGIIVGQALDKKTGGTPAFIAIPHDGDAPAFSPNPRVATPKQMRERLGPFGLRGRGFPSRPSPIAFQHDGDGMAPNPSLKVVLPNQMRDRLGNHGFIRLGLPPHPFTKAATLYVTGSSLSANTINIFTVPRYKQIGSIKKGISSPSSLWVDKKGDVYVANVQVVTEYAPQGDAPICSYGVKGAPSYVTTDDQDQVFVTSRGKGSYHHNYQISYLDGFKQCGIAFKHYEWNQPFFSYAAGVAADSSGDVFVSIYNGFEEFKNNDSKPTHLRARVNYIEPGALLIDKNKNLIAANRLLAQGNIYKIPSPYRSATVLASVKGAGNLSLNRKETFLYSGNGYNPLLTVYGYPSGKLIKTLKLPTQAPAGIAISPDASF